jgi:Zn-dependent M28 family amino/carboxypeptidase
LTAKFLSIAIVTTATLAAAADYVAEGNRWWSHIQTLADDNMEGRNTGSEGHRKAAQYVAGEFERAGLKPAGTSGYLQPMTFNAAQIDEPQCNVALVRDGKTEPLKLGEDVTIRVTSTTAPSIDAPLVFVGHGLVIPEANHDDFAGLNLKGAVVVILSGGPPSIAGPLKAHYSSAAERWKALSKAGAIGAATIGNPKSTDVPWARASLARFSPTMSLADRELDEGGGSIGMAINTEHADKFFAGTGHTIAEILALADAGKPLPRFPLNASLKAKIAYKKSQVESQNVVGVLEGSDPKLKNEYVVFSAHLDHLGVGQPINGDKIYNGAMDDASGIASLLEISRMMKEQNAKPKRSVVFLAVTGEEKGLQGSRYFAGHPTVKGDIIADINMDMFLPLFPLKYLEVQGVAESTLGDDIRAVAEKAGVKIQTDKEPDRNLFIRSDQYSFIRRGVPALAFKFGYEPKSPEEKLAKDWLKNRYHAPSDDVNQPVDKAAAAQFNRILLELAMRVANDPERPHWLPNSFFKRFAKT